MKITLIAFIAISSFLLSSCANTGIGTKIGVGAGAVTGGAACSKMSDNPVVIAFCAAIGAAIGGLIGYKLWDEKDKKEARHFLNTSKAGDVMSWKNPDTQHQFKMTLLETSTNNDGQKCRPFALVTNGKKSTLYQACKNKNGEWEFS
ncbi:MAG: hypothetical protein VSS52_004890 [Thiotrichaceae bacterium]|nr:hypothetical protein [Thiotrichaceae bacterium]